MKKSTINFSNLLQVCNQLEASLFYWRYSAPGIWPVSELANEDLKAFIAEVYAVAHTCHCMRMPIIAPDRKPYVYHETQWLEKRELIELSRQLMLCCDMDLLYEYRQPDLVEYEAIRLLEQTHAQLIGAVYARYPHEEIISAHEISFF